VGQDEEDRSRKGRTLIDDLHALECVEGMGKWAFSPQGVRAPVLWVGKVVSLPQKYVGGHEEGEDDGDYAIHGKESGVEFA
jgi:hypothetical protein